MYPVYRRPPRSHRTDGVVAQPLSQATAVVAVRKPGRPNPERPPTTCRVAGTVSWTSLTPRQDISGDEMGVSEGAIQDHPVTVAAGYDGSIPPDPNCSATWRDWALAASSSADSADRERCSGAVRLA